MKAEQQGLGRGGRWPSNHTILPAMPHPSATAMSHGPLHCLGLLRHRVLYGPWALLLTPRNLGHRSRVVRRL